MEARLVRERVCKKMENREPRTGNGEPANETQDMSRFFILNSRSPVFHFLPAISDSPASSFEL